MKFIPILFSTEMVESLITNHKTQTRRVMKPQPSDNVQWIGFGFSCFTPQRHIEGRGNFLDGSGVKFFKCPYGQPGDILWVRESFCLTQPRDPETYYFGYKDGFHSYEPASSKYYFSTPDVWIPSIHMPKEACRLFLKVKSIRVERLQDISEEDAIAEGIEVMRVHVHKVFRNYQDEAKTNGGYKGFVETAIASFKSLWQSINGEQSWKNNPWVWVIEFERINLTPSEMNLFLNNTLKSK